jgi:hypothetical protein
LVPSIRGEIKEKDSVFVHLPEQKWIPGEFGTTEGDELRIVHCCVELRGIEPLTS